MNHAILNSVLFFFFFSSCESQGANTGKRGRLSHMLRLIYLKVFFFLRAQSLDAWILLAVVWWMEILQSLVFLLLPRKCGGPFYFERKEINVVFLIWWLHKFAAAAPPVSSWALLQPSSVSAPSLLLRTLILRVHYLLICLIVPFKDSC